MTDTVSRPSRGQTCSAVVGAVGMRAPVLAVGDGALGFWAAVRTVFPRPGSSGAGSTRSPTPQRPAEVGAAGRERARWPESGTARTSKRPPKRRVRSSPTTASKWPKAVAKITDDLDALLEFYDYPAEHWIHLRTTKPDRVDVRDRQVAAAGHQGTRITGGRDRDGVSSSSSPFKPGGVRSTHPT